MLGLFTLLFFVYLLIHFVPGKFDCAKVLVLGGFPPIIALLLPKYSLFAILLSFISFWSTALSVGPHEVIYLVMSNALAWVRCYAYYQRWLPFNGDHDDDS